MACTSWRFIASLSDADQKMLTDAYHYAPKRSLRRRAHAVLLSHQGYAIDDIAEILEVKRNALSTWLKNWEAFGLPGLIDKPRSGRPRILIDTILQWVDSR